MFKIFELFDENGKPVKYDIWSELWDGLAGLLLVFVMAIAVAYGEKFMVASMSVLLLAFILRMYLRSPVTRLVSFPLEVFGWIMACYGLVEVSKEKDLLIVGLFGLVIMAMIGVMVFVVQTGVEIGVEAASFGFFIPVIMLIGAAVLAGINVEKFNHIGELLYRYGLIIVAVIAIVAIGLCIYFKIKEFREDELLKTNLINNAVNFGAGFIFVGIVAVTAIVFKNWILCLVFALICAGIAYGLKNIKPNITVNHFILLPAMLLLALQPLAACEDAVNAMPNGVGNFIISFAHSGIIKGLVNAFATPLATQFASLCSKILLLIINWIMHFFEKSIETVTLPTSYGAVIAMFVMFAITGIGMAVRNIGKKKPAVKNKKKAAKPAEEHTQDSAEETAQPSVPVEEIVQTAPENTENNESLE